MLRTTSGTRVLDGRDLDEVLALLDRDPVADVFVASRIEAAGLAPSRLGAEVWGYGDRGRLEAVCYSGANLVPVQAGPEAVRAFADRARRQGRRCSSIVGASEAVQPLWRVLEPQLGPGPRGACAPAADGAVRPARRRRRPRRAPGPAGRARRPAAGLHRDVHRGDRHLPDAGRRGSALPRAGAGAGRAGAGLRPHRGRPGAVQGRGRRGDPLGLPGAGRLGRARSCAAAGCRSAGPPPSSSSPSATSRPWSASTSTTTTSPRAAPTSGSGSARSGPSPACCSETLATSRRSVPRAGTRTGHPPPRRVRLPPSRTTRGATVTLQIKPGTTWDEVYARARAAAPEAFDADRILNLSGGEWPRSASRART